jgi:hypothetical protein
MNVKIVDKRGAPLSYLDLGAEGVLTPYLNKKSGLDDPMVVYPSGRFLHVDTIGKNGGTILDAETGKPVAR